jgi:hypothetical protein
MRAALLSRANCNGPAIHYFQCNVGTATREGIEGRFWFAATWPISYNGRRIYGFLYSGSDSKRLGPDAA